MPEPAAKTTAVGKPKPGSLLETLLALSTTPAERERAFKIAEQYQQQKMLAELSDAVMETSWGNKVSPVLRVQIIRYALDIGADPTRHLDVLGGKPYLNATFYRELLAAEPGFERADIEWLHNDARADEEENARRRALRVAHAVPEELDGNLGRRQSDRAKDPKPVPVLAACLVTLHFKGRGPFVGVKWSPSRAVDDVGLDFPRHTAESRAYRKAAEQAVSPWFRQHPMLQKMEALAVQAREIDVSVRAAGPEPGSKPVALDVPPMPAISPAAAAATVPAKPEVVRHAPSALCDEEGDHPAAECGYNQQARGGAA